jgi:hypothetical protein
LCKSVVLAVRAYVYTYFSVSLVFTQKHLSMGESDITISKIVPGLKTQFYHFSAIVIFLGLRDFEMTLT